MPARPIDPVFDGETLFHLADPRWIDGNSVNTAAITLPGTSCDRSKYRTDPLEMWGNTAAVKHPKWTAMVQMDANNLPADVPGKLVLTASGKQLECMYRFELLDDPLSEEDPDGPNCAHCQVTVRDSRNPVDLCEADIPSSRQEKLKHALAKMFRPCSRALDRPV